MYQPQANKDLYQTPFSSK